MTPWGKRGKILSHFAIRSLITAGCQAMTSLIVTWHHWWPNEVSTLTTLWPVFTRCAFSSALTTHLGRRSKIYYAFIAGETFQIERVSTGSGPHAFLALSRPKLVKMSQILRLKYSTINESKVQQFMECNVVQNRRVVRKYVTNQLYLRAISFQGVKTQPTIFGANAPSSPLLQPPFSSPLLFLIVPVPFPPRSDCQAEL